MAKQLFQGELMVCCLCGKKKRSKPSVESNWRALEVEEQVFYCCPKHFPPDATGTAEQFQTAYMVFMAKAIKLASKRGMGADENNRRH
jgi:hypothetical protein